jgi:8-hydroxy-5-deazaflavin:NADPH oxidoreductase
MLQDLVDVRPTGIPFAGDVERATQVASLLICEIGYEPVLISGLDMGKYLMPRTPLAGEPAPEEIRAIAAPLRP